MADKKKPAKAAPKSTAKSKPKPAAATPETRKVTAIPAAPGVTEESPLEGRPGTGAGTAVTVEHPHLGKINLRGDAGDKAFLAAVADAVGATPPVEANSVATGNGRTILWLGPDEWLIVTPPDTQGAVLDALAEALTGRHVSVVDVTDARTTIRLHGAHSRDVLAKGCPLDLHPRAFGAGRCAQTLIAKADVLIHQLDDEPAYDIYVLCSFSRYLWDWLADAATEFR